MTQENGKVPITPGAINWTMIALIVISGGGNFLATENRTSINQREIERAITEIHDLYPKLEEAIARQKQLQTTINDIKEQTRPR